MVALRISMAISATLLAASSALAMGGGGGGGGSMPSASTPQYDPAAEYQKGVAALQGKDFKAAKTAFDHVVPYAPKDANTHYLAGLARTGLNDWKGAKKLLEKAVKLNPGLIGARRELGVTYGKLGDTPNASSILAALQGQIAACAAGCTQAGELKSAVDAINAAMGSGPQSRADQ